MTDDLMHQKLIAELAESERAVPADERDFAAACERADSDPREQRRIRDIIDLIEAEDVIYNQALAALERGDDAVAVTLLRWCAEAGIGESAWFLAVALEKAGDLAEALAWYARAAGDGDQRAASRLAPEQLPAEPGGPAAGQESPSRSCTLAVPGWDTSWFTLPGGSHGVAAGHYGSWVALEWAAASAISVLIATCPDEDHTDGAWWPDSPGVGGWRIQVKHLSPPARTCRMMQKMLTSACLACWSDERVVRLSGMRRASAAASCPSPLTPTDDWTTLLSVVRRAECLPAWWQSVPLLRPGRPWAPRVIGGGLTAEDVMLPLPEVPALAPDATVHEALEQMLRSGARAVPVRDGGQVAGVIVLADLAQLVYQAPGMPSIQRVETLMRSAATVPAGMPLDMARSAAADDPAGFLVVVRPDGSATGYLTPEVLLASSSGPSGGQAPASGRPRTSRTSAGLLVAGVD